MDRWGFYHIEQVQVLVCSYNIWVKLIHAPRACQQLMLKLSLAISLRLSAHKWGPALAGVEF